VNGYESCHGAPSGICQLVRPGIEALNDSTTGIHPHRIAWKKREPCGTSPVDAAVLVVVVVEVVVITIVLAIVIAIAIAIVLAIAIAIVLAIPGGIGQNTVRR
jgi:hypothetical protein